MTLASAGATAVVIRRLRVFVGRGCGVIRAVGMNDVCGVRNRCRKREGRQTKSKLESQDDKKHQPGGMGFGAPDIHAR